MILIDEFSTGVDAKMKRDMWGTLRNVAQGKAVIITTRASFVTNTARGIHLTLLLSDSMEEASALASKVGIIAKRMLG